MNACLASNEPEFTGVLDDAWWCRMHRLAVIHARKLEAGSQLTGALLIWAGCLPEQLKVMSGQ